MTDREYSRDELEAAIWQWTLGRNGERDRMILRMYLFDGITYNEMLKRLHDEGYTIEIDRLKKIISHRKEQLFRHI